MLGDERTLFVCIDRPTFEAEAIMLTDGADAGILDHAPADGHRLGAEPDILEGLLVQIAHDVFETELNVAGWKDAGKRPR